MSMLNVQIYMYIKNKTFIIRSYISVSSKPSKTQLSFRRFGRNRNITPDNKRLIFIYIYIFVFFIYCNIVAAHTHTCHTGFTFT